MKKQLLVTAALLLGALSLFAQDTLKRKYFIPRKTYICNAGIQLGGGKSNTTTVMENSGFQFAINSRHGDFVTNNFVLGFQIMYGYSQDKYSQSDPFGSYVIRNKGHVLEPGIFMRYYKMFTPKFGFFGEFNAGVFVNYNRNTFSDQFSTSSGESYIGGVNIGLSPNIVYFVTPKLAIEGGFGRIGYAYRDDLKSSSSSNSGSFSLQPNLNVGMSLYFGKGMQTKEVKR